MKRHLLRVFIVLIGLIALFGCEQFFGANMFGAIDEPDPVAIDSLVEKLDEANAASSISRLNDAVENDTFFADLKASVSASEAAGEETNDVEEIVTFLKTQYTDTEGNPVVVTDENRDIVQDAALLTAKVNVETTSAAETIDNVTDLIIAATAEEGSEDAVDFDSTEDVVETILPASAKPPTVDGILAAKDSPEAEAAKEDFIKLVESLQEASDAYSVFGSALITEDIVDGEGNVIDTEVTAPDDVNMGEVAQSAVVAALVDTVVDDIATNNTLPADVSPAEVLFELVFYPDDTEYQDVTVWSNPPKLDEEGNQELDPETNEPLTMSPLDVAFEEEGMENLLDASGLLDLLEGMFDEGAAATEEPEQ